MTEDQLLEGLRDGVNLTRDFMAELTDYHGGPAETEYLLTSDIARAFLAKRYPVSVELLNRKCCSLLTSTDAKAARKALKGSRTDVVVGDPLAPDALIEVKIRIARYSGIVKDLRKLCATITWMTPLRQSKIMGVSLFQLHIAKTTRRSSRADFLKEVRGREAKFVAALKSHAAGFPDFQLTLKSLLQNPDDGIADADEDHDGHATRYYAVIIRHKLYGQTFTAVPETAFARMKTAAGR